MEFKASMIQFQYLNEELQNNTEKTHSERSDVVLIGNFFDLHSYVKQFHTLPSITFWYSSLDFKAASICSWENV